MPIGGQFLRAADRVRRPRTPRRSRLWQLSGPASPHADGPARRSHPDEANTFTRRPSRDRRREAWVPSRRWSQAERPATPGGSRRRAEVRKPRWVFVGASALPSDPVARQREQRGRKWLVASYFLCPCHLPLTLALIGAVFGGTALGAAVAGKAFAVGVALTVAYGVALWRGFRHIRMAKRIEAAGGALACTPDGCSITPSRS